jgi:prepilin-type N-terminal cleavage/methylation domain-containing protein
MHSKILWRLLNRFSPRPSSGFTLIEVLVVTIIIGILSAIAAPGYLSFVSRQRLNTAQSTVLGAIRDAQSKAKKDKVNYQVSFRENNGALQYVVHTSTIPACTSLVACTTAYAALPWLSVDQDGNKNILMGGVSAAYTTTTADPAPVDPLLPRVLRVRFSYKGNLINDITGRYIVLKSTGSGSDRRCVTVTTMLGATRTLREGQSSCPTN